MDHFKQTATHLRDWCLREGVALDSEAFLTSLARTLENHQSTFTKAYNATAAEVNATAIDHGFWDIPSSEPTLLMLMVTELAEACEGLRHGNPPSDHIPEFSAVEEELADTLIRIMDYGYAMGYRVAEALQVKMAFNRDRPRMHGGKRF